jgi:hypothetical protein
MTIPHDERRGAEEENVHTMHTHALSPEERQYLQHLNDRLAVIERQVKREALSLITTLEARVHDPADWLFDYEIELEVSFWLREDDPAYQEEDDNILVTLKEYLKGLRNPAHDFGIDDGMNHNEFQWGDGHPMQGEFHCWLYHCLYDHTDLWFEDMLRIGHIWVDLKVLYQHKSDVEP